MNVPRETIAAVATAQGRGGVGIVLWHKPQRWPSVVEN